jgi:pyruvate/2-oxoglutarate dehydrogenase complex dihydrolipoamide dehydrogenase (E3) component
VDGDLLLIAAGRVPLIAGLGLDAAGVSLNAKLGVRVDAHLRTTNRRVYAAGDCTGGPQFTHYAGFQGAIAMRNLILPFTSVGVVDRVVDCTFTSPEIASVGLSEAAAKQQFGEQAVETIVKELSTVDRAVCEAQTAGFIKIIYKARDTTILGTRYAERLA